MGTHRGADVAGVRDHTPGAQTAGIGGVATGGDVGNSAPGEPGAAMGGRGARGGGVRDRARDGTG